MSRVLLKEGSETEDALKALDWITCPTDAVLQLSAMSIRQLKKVCKGPKNQMANHKTKSGKKEDSRGAGGEDGKVYVLLNTNDAVDLLWFASVLPRHILDVLISENVPQVAASEGMQLEGGKEGGKGWFAYLARCMHVLVSLVQLAVEHSALMSALLFQTSAAHSGAKSPALLVDVLLFSQTVALAMRYDDESEAAAAAPLLEAEHAPAAAGKGQGEGGGAEGQAAAEEEGAGGGWMGAGGEHEAEGGGDPIDVVGMVLTSLALLLRIESKQEESSEKGRGGGGGGGGGNEADVRPFRTHLVGHPKVTKALCEGIFDAMDECFEQMSNGEPLPDLRRRRKLKSFVESAMEALFFCCTEVGFVADLLVCSYMRHGRALSVLKKVLYLDQVECVSLMLRWLVLFCEYESPPTVDVLAGYDLYNGLLLSVMDRNNDAMVEWSIKSPLNPIAYDLLKAVEIFADDSNFKQSVIDTSACAIASVLKRGPEFNGFTKSDSIHLPFTRGFFKLIGAMHCFNPKVMPAEEEHHLARSIVSECKPLAASEWQSVEASLQCLVNLPEIIRKSKDGNIEDPTPEDLLTKSKDGNIEDPTPEDLELVLDLLITVRRLRTEPQPSPRSAPKKTKKLPAPPAPAHEAKGFKAVGRPRKSGGKEEEEDENDEEEEEEEEALGVKGKGKGEKRSKGGARGGGGVSETQAKKAKTGAAPPPRSRLRMTDEDLIQQAILASMHDS